PEGPGRSEIDLQLQFRWQLNREIRRVRARENLASVIAGSLKYVEDTGAVAHQPTGCGQVRGCIERWDGVMSYNPRQLLMAGNEKRLSRYDQAGDPCSYSCLHGCLKVVVARCFNHYHRPAQRLRCNVRVFLKSAASTLGSTSTAIGAVLGNSSCVI